MERSTLIRYFIVTILLPIISGQEYVVSIQNSKTQTHRCNGVILHERWILTAAKCIKNLQLNEIDIFYGSKLLNKDGTRVGIEIIEINPGFNETRLKDDVALLFTTAKINFIANVTGPVILPAIDVPINRTLIVRGWKLTNVSSIFNSIIKMKKKPKKKKFYFQTEDNSLLQQQTTTAISSQQCRELNPSLNHVIRSWLICTDIPIEPSSCFDGLGSPLVSEDNIIFGIVSMFRSTCGLALNDIYTNVYTQVAWIWFVIEGL